MIPACFVDLWEGKYYLILVTSGEGVIAIQNPLGAFHCRGTRTVHASAKSKIQNPQSPMSYYAIYDGNCNLCVNFVRQLEEFDRGKLFQYVPMQDEQTLTELGVSASDCEQGMMLIDASNLSQRWQGSEAAEAIGKLLPGVSFGIDLYRWIPGLKWLGDRSYLQIRDNRYNWFGKRDKTYISPYQFKSCREENCSTST